MKRKVFVEGKNLNERAYIGWQDTGLSLYGLKEGYKNAADDLVELAIIKGSEGRIDILDTYIFPIMFSYRHSIEISLKLIYSRVYGDLPNGGHNLLTLWDHIIKKVITCVPLNLSENELKEIKELIKELQGKGKNEDSRADVWRYLINKEGDLYFTEWNYIDYKNLKLTLNYLYDFLDGLYYAVDDYFSV